MSLSDVIEALVEERGLEKEILNNIVCEGMLSAYQKKYPDLNLRISLDKQASKLTVEVAKTIVASVENEEAEISLRKAKNVSPDVVAGDVLWVPFESPIGRIEILKAKQVIAQKIRQIEASCVYEEFKDRQGLVLQGIVHKSERGGTIVKMQDHLAFLPKSLSVPGEKLSVGHPVRALLKEVLDQPRNENQLILDRASAEFVQELFSLEIPEVYEKLVEIKKAVRIPGYKTKVAVVSNDSNIDPVGTCVGVGGVRVKPILKELGSEKIDIISWTDNLESFVRSALKPAEINRIVLSDDNAVARVWLDDDQRSLAIGKMGQNINLASKITGVEIELVQSDTKDLEQKLSEEF